ncbi:MAG: iron-containing alcohol dehydrogenase, partial [Candidatus Helarchaeota archaeon]|nr:iron-containing alcohol dehydrogenase [Candidatus Helarchaeota archaeon]
YSSSGIAHSCGHALGGVHQIQHGISVGVMLPYVLEFNKPECEEKYIEILKALNVTDIGDPTTTLVKMIKELLKKVNLPTTLKELIPANEWNQNLDKLVEFAKTDLMAPFNPRATLEEDFRKIFQYAYEGKNVDW